MADAHLTRDEIERLVAGAPYGDPVAAVVHLVVCPECTALFEQTTGERGRIWLHHRLAPAYAGDQEGADVDLVVLAARFRVLTSGEVDDVLQAAALADELECVPRETRALRAANVARFRSVALGDELLRRARRTWRSEPERAEEMAETAVAVLTGCRLGGQGTRPIIQDGLACAWASVANAQRVQGRLRAAQESLDRAVRHLESGSGEAEAKAWCCRAAASLYRDRRLFEEARHESRVAREEFLRAGLHREGFWMEVQEALIEGEAGRLERSIRLFERFLACHSVREVGPEVHRLARHNLAVTLAQSGRGAAARRVFAELMADQDWSPDPVSALRVQWTEGLIFEAEGRLEAATTRLFQVQESFAARRLDYDAALAALDLVRMRLRSGDTARVRRLAGSIETLFRARGIHREASLAGLYLAEALRRDRATVALVADVLDFLHKARRDPSFSFHSERFES